MSRSTTPLPFQVGVCVAATPDAMPLVAFDSYAAQRSRKVAMELPEGPFRLVAGESVQAYAPALEHVRLVGPGDGSLCVGGKPVRADLKPAVV